MLKDRRKATRQDVSFTDSVGWFAQKDRLYPIHIVNRSEEGLGVILRQRPPVDVGETVRMEWLRPSFMATEVVVRSVVKIDMDEWYIGVELAAVSTSSSAAHDDEYSTSSTNHVSAQPAFMIPQHGELAAQEVGT